MPKIITTNMAIDKCDPAGRYERFTDYCRAVRPDFIAVQEVCHDIGQSALRDLAIDLGEDYEYRYSRIYPGQENSQGVAVVTNWEITTRPEMTELEPIDGMNKIQLLELVNRQDGRRLQLANIHAEAHLLRDYHRGLKLARLIRRLNPDVPQILAGDFNAIPHLPSIKFLKSMGYRSAHEAVHGHEPSHTYPTAIGEDLLLNGGDATRFQRLAMKAGAGLFQAAENRLLSGLPRVVCDYIFGNHLVQVESINITGYNDAARAHSDHLGLEADLVIN